MAKLPRKTQKIFCSKPTSENQTSVFGTMKTADKQYSTDVGTLQSNAAYEQGWKSATIANYKPFMEDFNTLNYINTSQLAYLFQQGIPEWDESTAYYKNSFCSYNGDLWKSLIDDNLNNTPLEGESWTLFTSGKKSGSGLELCDIGMALYVDETKGLRRYLNGQIVDINTNTQAFLNRLKQITTLHPSLLCTEEEWQTAKTMSAFGQVGKFVFNYSGDKIVSVRLPRVVNVQGLFDLQNLGMTVSAGLPNITCQFTDAIIGVNQSSNGCLHINKMWDGAPGGSAWKGFSGRVDASLSNPIYGKSNTVQPEAIQYPYFIQIATGSETENNIINDIELNNPYSLFDSKYSDHELNNLSWLKSEGQWNSKAVYPSAYDELLMEYNNSASVNKTEGSITFKRTPKGYKIALADQETAIDTKYTTDGIAWYYILDTTNEKFKLPRTKFGFEGLRTNVGDDIKAGLPNITGTFKNNGHASFMETTGAFNCTKDNTGSNDGSARDGGTYSFDASRSNHIYGKSDTVQPPATQMYLYFYVGETVQNANLIDAGRIGEQLATKTDMLQASGASMPSNRYIDLTLGASGTAYTAPANGWVIFTFWNVTKTGYLNIFARMQLQNTISYTGGTVNVYVPVSKGETFKCNYDVTGSNLLRFYYAEGSK